MPADLEAIVLKATAKLPEERYGTAAALADDLRAFLEGRAIAARRPGVLHLLRLIVRRHRALAAAVSVFLLVLLATTGVYLRGVARARDQRDRQLYSATLAAAEATLSINPGTASGPSICWNTPVRS